MKFYLLLVTVFILSCQKTIELKDIPQQNLGLLPDDPIKVANVQLIVSKDFLISNRGKPDKKPPIVVDPPLDTLSSYDMKVPPIGSQGREGSCVAFAVGYGAKSIHEYYKNAATSYSYSTNIFSPEFLYNQTKFGDCGSGTAMQTALDFIKTNGIVPWSIMPYTDTDCSTLPTAQQSIQAQVYKISEYYKIYTTDSTMIKTLVRQNKAVIIGICVDYAFMNAKTGFIWKNTGSALGVGHSIVIIGYNDQLKAWKIINSFGTAWGTNGFAYIEYSMFPTRTGTYCYSIK